MEIKPSDVVLKLVKESINLAMDCVETGETLLAFIMTAGDPGAIHSLAGGSSDEVLNMAQEVVDGFGPETTAFAFAYDGFLTLRGEKTDCVFVEAAEIGGEKIFKFAQRYRPKKFSHPVERIGNFMCLERRECDLRSNPYYYTRSLGGVWRALVGIRILTLRLISTIVVYLSVMLLFAGIDRFLEFHTTKAFNPPLASTVGSIYFSTVTIITLGYGDITPDTILAKLSTTIEALAGVFLLAILIGLVISLSIDVSSKHNKANSADAKSSAAD